MITTLKPAPAHFSRRNDGNSPDINIENQSARHRVNASAKKKGPSFRNNLTAKKPPAQVARSLPFAEDSP